MAAFVDQQQHDKADRPFPAEHHRVNADHQEHRAARFQDQREELQERQEEEFELREEFRDDHAELRRGERKSSSRPIPASMGGRSPRSGEAECLAGAAAAALVGAARAENQKDWTQG